MSTATKPPRPAQRSAPARRSGGGGGGFWLVVVLAVGALGALFVFAPELPRQWLGLAKAPADKGPEPTAPETVKTDLASKDHTADSDLAKSQIKRDSLASAPKQVAPKPVEAEKPKTFADEAKGQAHIAEAEKAYKAMQWAKAATEAKRADGLQVTPATRIRAADIVKGSAALEKLFRELDDKDELIRYYDTHPSLVTLNSGTSTSLAVPITSLDFPTPVETDPIAWITSQRRTGKVAFLIKGKKDFIPSSLPADNIGEVKPADLAAIIAEKKADFDSRLNKLKNGSFADNALAWYDAGRFAYRNRLDDYVTEMLDRAQVLDLDLVRSVREDKAAGLFANLMCHLKNGNRKQADAFMAIISRKYTDTDQGKQARLFYDGKTTELLAAAKAAEQKRVADEKARREAQLARAKELGDDKAMAKLQQKPAQPEEEEPEAAAVAASGDEAQADTLLAKGREAYNKAIDAGNTPERDVLYEKAYHIFNQCQALLSKLVEKNPSNSSLEAKLHECSQLRYGTIKQRRFH
jgi:hypothetical protein